MAACCPPCAYDGHCNVHANACMQRLGHEGINCDEVGPRAEKMPAAYPRVRSNDGQHCPNVRDMLGRLRSYARRWSNATAAGRSHSCLNHCNGRGQCLNGWCSCRGGSFGIDCAHHAADSPPRPPPSGLAIYVYEPPASIAFTFGRSITKSRRSAAPVHNLTR